MTDRAWKVDYERERVKEFIENAIARIRRIADDIEREYKPRAEANFQTPKNMIDRFSPNDPYFAEVHVLYAILHEIHWGIANLTLERIPALLNDLERAKTELKGATRDDSPDS